MQMLSIKELFKWGALWAGLSLPLNLAWEIAQLPLYAIPPNQSGHVAYGILHCTIGDGLIAGVGFLVTGYVLRAGDWPTQRRQDQIHRPQSRRQVDRVRGQAR